MKNPTPFVREHLTPDQVRELYAEALAQAEAGVLSAWVNYQLAPHDDSRAALYAQQAEALQRLKSDLARVAPPSA